MHTISKEFTFDSAHSLPHLPASHKCHHMHGHTYKLRVHVSGPLLPMLDWVIDYADIKSATAPLVERLDHKNLNDVLGITTTAENIAKWFYDELTKVIPVSQVDIHETTGTCCSYSQ